MKKIFVLFALTAHFICSAQSRTARICNPELSKYGLQGKTISEVLDYGAKLHNDYQDYVLNQIYLANSEFRDTMNLRMQIEQQTKEFFEPKGLDYHLDMSLIKIANSGQTDFIYVENNFSQEAKEILIRLRDIMKNYDENNDISYFQEIDNLKNLALSLTDEKEVYAVGLPVYVAENSIKYWKQKGQYWLGLFTKGETVGSEIKEETSNTLTQKKTGCKVNFWHLGGADVAGGIQGGISGTALGPGGAFAGAILGSSSSSLVNLTNQAFNCLFSWWPF